MSFDAGVPLGTAQLALTLAAQAAGAASELTGRRHVVDGDAVLGHLLLPLVAGDVPVVAPPRPAPGGGWVHADVLPEDEELYGLLAAEGGDAEDVAARAQACRLPVTPYRAGAAPWRLAEPAAGAGRRRDPSTVTVIDLTAMWAGPLATRQLAAWGATVLTVEPDVRRDGLRALPTQFAVLAAGKQRRQWDLRRAADRARFEAAVDGADVLVESFSPRVMANLGYPADVLLHRHPGLLIVQLRAFPSTGPEAGWVAYGRGVHAASGLGMLGGVPRPALLAYPDPLAGLATFGAVLVALAAGRSGPVEVSLAGAMAPLLREPAPLGEVDGEAIAGLRARIGRRPGAVVRAA